MAANNEWLSLCEMTGPSGGEEALSKRVAELFSAYSGDVWTDGMMNTYARMGGRGPRVLVAAHVDEIGLMVNFIDDAGYVGFCAVGGVDPRILPAQEVIVHGKEDLYGIIAVKPPHVLTPQEREKVLAMEDLRIDLGLPAEKVKKIVRVGDYITFDAPPVHLLGDMVATKSSDDRMGVGVMLEAMRILQDRPLSAEVIMMASVQEEVGARGALVAAQNLMPELAVAIDVTHGKTPDAPAFHAVDLDKPCIAIAPILHQGWTRILRETAKELEMEVTVEISGRTSGTDADEMQIAGEGIACVCLSVPERYMHTTVETLSTEVVAQCGRLLAAFLEKVTTCGEVLL